MLRYLLALTACAAGAVVALGEEPRTLTPQQLRGDIGVLRAAVEQVHPRPYRYAGKPAVDAALAGLERDAGRGMAEGEFFRRISQLTAMIGCGHTQPNLLNQDAGLAARVFDGPRLLPFYFRVIDGRVIVTHNASENAAVTPGTELLRLDGRPAREVIDQLATIAKSDGRNTAGHRLASLEVRRSAGESRAAENLFDVYYPLFFPRPGPTFDVEAADPQGRPLTFRVPAVNRADRVRVAEQRYGKVPAAEASWEARPLEGGAGYLRLGTFYTMGWSTDTRAFLAKAFADLRRRGAKHLIVDLRGNAGGLTQHPAELKAFLAKAPLPPRQDAVAAVRATGVERSLAAHLTTGEDTLRAALQGPLPPQMFRPRLDGLFQIVAAPAEPPVQPHPDHFTGQVYFLADARVASATFRLLDDVRHYKLGTIVGQETGGNRQGLNTGIYFLRLPNSAIEVDLPAIASVPTVAAKDEGVKPDWAVEPTAADVARGVDAELAYVLSRLKAK